MTDRDTFAAAALTGLLARRDCYDHELAILAYDMADAMLRERGNHPEKPDSSTNHDASPDARGQNPTECSCLHREGCSTGNTDDAATGEPGGGVGFSPGSRTGPISRTPERESPRRECGESSLRDVARPDTKGKVAGGPEHHISEAENAKEPVAWAVMERDGFGIEGTFTDRDEAAEWCDSRQEIVPLYRHPQPTLTDAEREAVEWYAAYGAGHHADTLRKLLDRLHA